MVLADGSVVRTGGRARKSSAGYDLTRLFIGSEGTLGIVTEVTLRLHGIPETVQAATCTFPSIESAVDAAIALSQFGVPVAKMEMLDTGAIAAINRHTGATHEVRDTLFFEFNGGPQAVAEQIETARSIVEDYGGSAFKWAANRDERLVLWKARHEAYYSAIAARPGAKGWATDVCVPVSNLAKSIFATKELLARCTIPASIMGHVGDGNYHVVFALDPDSEEERAELGRINTEMIEFALALDGTCTGEHGIGIGKIFYMYKEHGKAVDVMWRIKAALDPENLLNPGKVLPPQTLETSDMTAEPATIDPLVSADWLADHLGQVRVIDATYLMPADEGKVRDSYMESHIPARSCSRLTVSPTNHNRCRT